MPRPDNCHDEESDSNSDDGGPFSPESNKAAINRFEDSKNLEETELTTSFQSMSIKLNTEGRDHGRWIRSSSESSSCSSTSHSDSDSGDESSEDEERIDFGEDMRKKLAKLALDSNSNYEATSKNYNHEGDKFATTHNIPISFKNEDSDVSASSDDSSDDDSSDDDSENEGVIEVIARGPSEKPYYHSGKKPYDRESPKHESTTEAHASDNRYLYPHRSIPGSSPYGESDPASDDSSNDYNSNGEIESEVFPSDPYSISSYYNGETPYMPGDTLVEEFISSADGELPNLGENDLGEIQLPNDLGELNPIIDKPEMACLQVSRHSPTELPLFGAAGYGDDNSTNSPPLITINGIAGFSIQSPEYMTPRKDHPPLSPTSSLNSVENNEPSPGSYVNATDSDIELMISQDFLDLGKTEPTSITNMYEIVCSPANHEPLQAASPAQSPYSVPLGDMEHQTNAYTQYTDSVVSMQENMNICSSDFYPSPVMQTGTQAQTSTSQITGDSYFPGTTPLAQYPNNFLQCQPLTLQPLNGIQPKVNSLSTSRGIMKITPKDEVQHKVTGYGQIGAGLQAQTNNTIDFSAGQTSEPRQKANPKKSTIPIAPSLIPSTIEDDSHLPTTVEKLNMQSSYEKRDSRPINTWLLSRLPSTSAFEKLRRKVTKKKAEVALSRLYEYTYDHYRERNKAGDTYLMSIVRNPTKLSSRLAHIAPVLNKMRLIPDSLTMQNKEGHDALYMAAINCPEFGFVTGVIAATIAESCKSNDIWQRRYNEKNETLLHALAARGDSHLDVLQELLAVQKTSGRTLFDLSAKNIDGKTPLHVAVGAHDLMRSVDVVKELMDYGADPLITDDNGNTSLHMAMSNTSCLGIVQTLLRQNGEKAVNIQNNSGNTPLHLAASLLNNVDQNTQEEVCWQLISFGGQTNIRNRSYWVPFAYVAAERRERMEKIFYKKL